MLLIILFIYCRTKTLVQIITLPTSTINAVAWGGPNNDILFVASEAYTYNMLQGGLNTTLHASPAGAIFKVEGIGATGVPARKYSLEC